MSGSTIVRREAERFAIQLETPCISFATGPDGASPEQDYHRRAQAQFEALLDAIGPGLPDALERAATIAGVTTAPRAAGRVVRVDTATYADGHSRGLPQFGFIEIGVAAPLDGEARARLQAAVIPELAALLPPEPEPALEPAPEPAPVSWFGRLRRMFGR